METTDANAKQSFPAETGNPTGHPVDLAALADLANDTMVALQGSRWRPGYGLTLADTLLLLDQKIKALRALDGTAYQAACAVLGKHIAELGENVEFTCNWRALNHAKLRKGRFAQLPPHESAT